MRSLLGNVTRALEWDGFFGQDSVAGPCEHGNEPSVSIKEGDFFEHKNCQLLKKGFIARSKLTDWPQHFCYVESEQNYG
jgi:hypothetical protein